jgi:mannose-1-phosphate guanylyltransferase
MSHLYGLILAGGRGTRFWPRSRRSRAKQVLNFFGERTLIQQTVDRLKPLLPPERIWVLTNHHLRAEIVKQLPEIPKGQILAEPAQRNTAPAIGLAAQIISTVDPEAVMGVFPADHVITMSRDYVRLLRPAFRAANEGKIVVIGIQPRWAETGYGYVEFDQGEFGRMEADAAAPRAIEPIRVTSFREKPDLKTAEAFVAAGNFYWNAGMFFWKTSVLLDNLRQFQPKTASLLASLPPITNRQFAPKLEATFPLCENISIDYAVLERAKNVVGIPAGDIGWSDVGSWNAIYELHKRDAEGNVLSSPSIVESSTGNYVEAGKKLVALLGVKDLIVVDTPDALLIADRGRAQEVGDLVKRLEKAGHDHLL